MKKQRTTPFILGDRIKGKVAGVPSFGTIVARAKYRGDWLVKFDNDPYPKPRAVAVYEKDIEHL